MALLPLMMGCRAGPVPLPPLTPTVNLQALYIGLTSSASGLEELVSASYEARSVHTKLQFVTANTETLLADLKSGQMDAILVHHVPDEESIWFNPVAVDGLVIIVHPENPASDITLAEVQAIFSGQLTNWAAVGGPNLEIAVVSREPGSGARTIFLRRIMSSLSIAAETVLVPDDQSMQAAILADPAAIGFSMMGAAESPKVLALNGFAALPETTAAQVYPLSVPLYFVSRDEPMGQMRDFLAWLQSNQGQSVLGEKYGRVR